MIERQSQRLLRSGKGSRMALVSQDRRRNVASSRSEWWGLVLRFRCGHGPQSLSNVFCFWQGPWSHRIGSSHFVLRRRPISY